MTAPIDPRCPYPAWCVTETLRGEHRSTNYDRHVSVQIVAAGDVTTVEVAGHPLTLDEAAELRHSLRVVLAVARGGWPLLRLRLGIWCSDTAGRVGDSLRYPRAALDGTACRIGRALVKWGTRHR